MTAELTREVWVFFPDKSKAQSAAMRTELRKTCRELGWRLEERPIAMFRTRNGRPAALIDGRVAVNMYRRLHRARVAVIALESASVCLSLPAKEAVRHGRLLPLRDFVKYKCFYEKCPHEPEAIKPSVARFSAWCDHADCENDLDCRCLPFHVFDGDSRDLSGAPGRSAFDSKYGSGSSRTDERGRKWTVDAQALHGFEQLHVAGRLLRKGFHWDVSPKYNETTIHTIEERWRVFKYLNVYPDAIVRGRSPNARRI